MKTVVIFGTSNPSGNTKKISEKIAEQNQFGIIDLSNYKISYYDYEHKNKKDDFIPLMEDLIDEYDTFIFSTPVYWYSMSGIMKVFFDRISDLLTIKKEIGRKLRGKNMYAIANSESKEALEYDFFLPFKQSAKYLGMNYIGDAYFSIHLENDYKINL